MVRSFLARLVPVSAALIAAAAQAQQATGPPQPTLNRAAQAWVGFLIIFVLVVLVMGVSLMPAKRGHQD